MTWLRPILSDIEYGFATLAPDAALPASIEPIATFAEPEGLTLIAPAARSPPPACPTSPAGR